MVEPTVSEASIPERRPPLRSLHIFDRSADLPTECAICGRAEGAHEPAEALGLCAGQLRLDLDGRGSGAKAELTP